MDLDKAMIVAGVGCRRGAAAPDIEAAVRAALDRAGIASHALDRIATTAAKHGEAGIVAAAAKLGVDLVLIPEAELQAVNDHTETRSDRVLALTGVHSVAEAAALVAAGPSARLIGSRLVMGDTACAIAASEVVP